MASEPLTVSDREAFRGYLRRTAPFDDADLAAIEVHARIRRLSAHSAFLTCGERAVDCATVLAGVLREYYPLADGREVTRGFAGPGSYVGSLSDLLSSEPARSSVVAEADSRLVVVPWRRMRELVAQRPAWAALDARVTERLYLAKAAREYELLVLDAEARYQRFRALYAALEPVIALRHVASYVGVTPEHLSRLRRRLGIAGPRPSGRTRRRTRSSAPDSPPAAVRSAPRTATRPAPASRR
jgi:CRP-like cAMP-binding protein